MGNERSIPAGTVCSGCSSNVAVGPEAGHKCRGCCAPNCGVVYCGHCKHRVMMKLRSGQWLCPTHAAKYKAAKRRGEDPEGDAKMALKKTASKKGSGVDEKRFSLVKQTSAIDVEAMKAAAGWQATAASSGRRPSTPGLRLQTGVEREMPRRRRPVSSRHPAVKHRMSPAQYDETVKSCTRSMEASESEKTRQSAVAARCVWRSVGVVAGRRRRRIDALLGPAARRRSPNFGRSTKTKAGCCRKVWRQAVEGNCQARQIEPTCSACRGGTRCCDQASARARGRPTRTTGSSRA